MGKRELRYTPMKWLLLGMLLILIPFGIYLFFWSTPAEQLESKYIQEAGHSVENVSQIPLLGGGLAVVSDDTSAKALMQIYAKVPMLDRYMFTESYNFREESGTINYHVRVWSGHARLQWDKEKVIPTGWSGDDGWGVCGKILLYFLWAETIWVARVLIVNDIIKTRKEKAANPVKNY